MAQKHDVALAHPCLLAEECLHPRFMNTYPNATVILTINSGYE